MGARERTSCEAEPIAPGGAGEMSVQMTGPHDSVVFPICVFKDRWLDKGRKGLRSNPFSTLLNPERIKQSPALVCFPRTTTLTSGHQGNGKASPALEMRRRWACRKGVYDHLSHAPPTLRLLYILLYQICLALQRKAPIPESPPS